MWLSTLRIRAVTAVVQVRFFTWELLRAMGEAKKKKKDSGRFVGTFWPLEVQNVVSVLAVAIPVTRAFSKYC